MSDDVAQVTEDVLEMLPEVNEWQLAPGRWEQFDLMLEAVLAAHASGDDEVFVAAATQLLLNGPPRIVRIGSTPKAPPPKPVRERLNRLVHVLSNPGKRP